MSSLCEIFQVLNLVKFCVMGTNGTDGNNPVVMLVSWDHPQLKFALIVGGDYGRESISQFMGLVNSPVKIKCFNFKR